MKTFSLLVATSLLLAVTVTACSGGVETTETPHADPNRDSGREGTDGGATSMAEAGPVDGASDAGPTTGKDAGATACLDACHALIPGGAGSSALLLYACGTTCGPAGECGTQNLFGSSVACTACMLTSQNQSCISARAQCNDDKTCADFAACVGKCL